MHYEVTFEWTPNLLPQGKTVSVDADEPRKAVAGAFLDEWPSHPPREVNAYCGGRKFSVQTDSEGTRVLDITEGPVNEKMLEAQGFKLGTAHRDQGVSQGYAGRSMWHPAYLAGYRAGLLPDDMRTALQIMFACGGNVPLAEVRGNARGAGYIGDQGLLTDTGREIAEILIEHDKRE